MINLENLCRQGRYDVSACRRIHVTGRMTEPKHPRESLDSERAGPSYHWVGAWQGRIRRGMIWETMRTLLYPSPSEVVVTNLAVLMLCVPFSGDMTKSHPPSGSKMYIFTCLIYFLCLSFFKSGILKKIADYSAQLLYMVLFGCFSSVISAWNWLRCMDTTGLLSLYNQV